MKPRACVDDLPSYVPGATIESARERYQLTGPIIKLASNENPRGGPERLMQLVSRSTPPCERYPDDSAASLRGRLAERLAVAADQVTLGNGSSDLLTMAARVFLEAGTEAIVSSYTFSLYPIIARACGATVRTVPCVDYRHDLDGMLRAITPRTRVIFVDNPNNPTGTWLTDAEVRAFVAAVPAEVLVVLDEAYVEYSTQEPGYASALPLLAQFPNLLITRTFSKAYGLAGLRLGYAISSPTLADWMGRVRQPFNVNTVAHIAGAQALDDQAFVERSVRENRQGRTVIAEALRALGITTPPSAGNFVFAVFDDAQPTARRLAAQGILVRTFGAWPEAMRITVGVPEENAAFVQKLGAAAARVA
ncbi:MAG: histidinol-phosphate transaminase [Polyangia bacterium]